MNHRGAIKQLLAACTIPGFPEGQVIDKPVFPYWVLFMDTGSDDQEKLCGTSNKTTFRWQVTSVGETDDAAEIVASKTYALLVDVRPVVVGWSPGLIRRVTSIPVRADKDVFLPGSNLHPMYAVDTYMLVSRKD